MQQPIILHKDSNITVTMKPMKIFLISTGLSISGKKYEKSVRAPIHPMMYMTTQQMNQLALCC